MSSIKTPRKLFFFKENRTKKDSDDKTSFNINRNNKIKAGIDSKSLHNYIFSGNAKTFIFKYNRTKNSNNNTPFSTKQNDKIKTQITKRLSTQNRTKKITQSTENRLLPHTIPTASKLPFPPISAIALKYGIPH